MTHSSITLLRRTLLGALAITSLTVWGGQTMPTNPQEVKKLRQAVAQKKKENEALARRVKEMEAQLKAKSRLSEEKAATVRELRKKLEEGKETPAADEPARP